jgi:uncharacterized protein (TIGR03083 family)
MANMELYLLGQRRMTEVLTGLGAEQLAGICPSCPEWSVQDVVAHHIHFLNSCISDNVPDEVYAAITEVDPRARVDAGSVRDEWTQAGVEARRGQPLAVLLAEWNSTVASMPPSAARAVLDLAMHLGDVIEAVGHDAEIDNALLDYSLQRYHDFALVDRFAALGASVSLRCTDSATRIGGSVDGVEVSGTAYELLRAVGGRRTRLQADLVLDWGDASEAVRSAFSAYGWSLK